MVDPKNRKKNLTGRWSWAGRLARLCLVLFLAICVVQLTLLLVWRIVPPTSTLMLARYALHRPVERQWVPLDRVSPHLVAAVLMSEDGRFCRHNGVDWPAMHGVLSAGGAQGPSRGASTIAMQTAKNLFLWPQRSFLRKGLEIPLALAIDFAWPKRRVLEIYLNIAEWGDGIFGIEAASRRYFGKSAAALVAREAALLATTLPNPALRNPVRPTRKQIRLAAIVLRRVNDAGPWLDCLK